MVLSFRAARGTHTVAAFQPGAPAAAACASYAAMRRAAAAARARARARTCTHSHYSQAPKSILNPRSAGAPVS
eukprot:COSAG01_NODE_5562_length_4179_cov_8.225514_1_plen_72_part_10